MGKVGTPQERDAINSLLNSMMFIVLGDDTVFQRFWRARQHTQKNRLQMGKVGTPHQLPVEFYDVHCVG